MDTLNVKKKILVKDTIKTMKNYFLLLNMLLLAAVGRIRAQPAASISLPLLANEQWWGGTVQYGYLMPFNKATTF